MGQLEDYLKKAAEEFTKSRHQLNNITTLSSEGKTASYSAANYHMQNALYYQNLAVMEKLDHVKDMVRRS